MSIYRVESLKVIHEKKMVLEDISFDIEEKGVYAILGKSAHARYILAKTLAGIIPIESGNIFYKDVIVNRRTTKGRAARAKIGYLPRNCFLYGKMTVYEVLDFTGAIRKINPDKRVRQIKEALELVMLSDKSEAIVGSLSVYEKKRLLLANALIGNPAVLILDEPMMHLPPDDVALFKDIIEMLAEKKTIILFTDKLALAEELATHIGIISNKKMALWSSLDNIKEKLDGDPNALLKAYAAFADGTEASGKSMEDKG